MSNPYFDLKKQIQTEEQAGPTNPYLNLAGKDIVGTKLEPAPETPYRRLTDAREQASVAQEEARKANRWRSIAWDTVKGTPKAAFDLAGQIIDDPKASAREFALGLANGLTFGGTDALQRRAFINEAKKGGIIDEETARSMAEKMLTPDDNELRALRGAGDFAGMVVPYAAAENLAVRGLSYAAPAFVSKYAKTAKILADIGVFNSVGQIEESFKEKGERNRLTRAAWDTGAAVTFFLGGEVFRRIRGTQFKSPFQVGAPKPFEGGTVDKVRSEIANSQAFDVKGAIAKGDIPREAVYKFPDAEILTEGFATGRIDDVAQKLNRFSAGLGETYRKAVDPANSTYKDIVDKGLAVLDDFTTKHAGIKEMATDAAKADVRGLTTVTIKRGAKEGEEVAAKAGAKAAGEELTVATNDLEALRNYIKGSNSIDYKVLKGGLGEDISGRTVAARHEFNPKTGKHIIYATDQTTASNLAHELGHYFDKDLTKTTMGLARLLPEFEKNREPIEDALGSFAVSRLGGNATGEIVSREIATIAKSLKTETKLLSGLRQGGAAQARPSEAFADAVAEILTNKEAAAKAPVLAGLLKHLDELKATELLGKNVAKELKDSGVKFAAEVTTKGGKEVVQTTLKTPALKLSEIKVPKGTEAAATTIQKINTKLERIANRFNDSDGGVAEIKNAMAAVERQRENIAAAAQGIREGGDAQLAAQVEKTLAKRADEVASQLKDYGSTLEAKVKAVKEKGPGAIIEKEVPKKLERTPTGKQPRDKDLPDMESIPVRTELVTADEEVKKLFDEKILPKVTGEMRIGKSNQDIIERSFSSKMTEKDFDNILTERFGNLSEDVVKAKRIMNDKSLAILEKLSGRDVADIPAAELGEITSLMNQVVEMFEVMGGVRTELSNSFRSLGIAVAPGENDVLRQVVGEIQRVIGKEVNGFNVAQKLLKLRENTVVDKYFTVWYPAILSGPKTTSRNIVGTGMSLVTDTMSQLFSSEGRRTFSERLTAMVGAQKEAWTRAKGILKGDAAIISKFHEGIPLKEEAFKGKFKFLNKVEYVGRFLDAQDAYFSTVAKEGEVAALRAGEYTYGLESREIAGKINEAVSNAFSQRITYRSSFDPTAVGLVGRAATTLKSSDNQAVKGFFTFVMPFVRTVANVTDRKLDYVPIVNLARTFGPKIHLSRARAVAREIGLKSLIAEDAIAGGMERGAASKFAASETERIIGTIAERLKHQQMGKMYMGLSAVAGTVPLAMAGRITGSGPKNKNERDTLMQKGWRPNSLILPGGIVLPYQNLGPMAGVFSLAGNIHDAVKYGNADEKGLNNLFWSGIDNFIRGELDQSFVSGIAGIYDAVYGFKEFDQLLGEMASNAIPIPAAWTQTKDIIFPERFEAKGFLDQTLNKLGFTGGLEPKLNAFGEQYSGDLIWGLTPKLLNTDDPVLNWMDENNVFVGKPQKGTKIEGRAGDSREMTPEEYTKYLEATGQAIYRELNQKIKTGSFNRFKTEEEKKKAVTKIVNDIRSREKRKFKF